jgi:hypothetical protein
MPLMEIYRRLLAIIDECNRLRAVGAEPLTEGAYAGAFFRSAASFATRSLSRFALSASCFGVGGFFVAIVCSSRDSSATRAL